MAYCLKCGAKLEDDDIICPFCGGQTGGVGRLKQLSDEMVVDVRTLLHTEDQTDKMDSYEVKAGRVPASLSYLGILLIIPLLSCKRSEFIRFHANQGLVLLITAALSFGSVKIAGWIFGFLPAIGEVIAALLVALWGIVFVLCMIIGFVGALRAKAKPLPIIGKFHILK